MLPTNAADKLDGEKDKLINKSILDELHTRCDLRAQITYREMAFFGNTCRNNKCNHVETCILGLMPGKRRRGAPGCNTSITSRSGRVHRWKKT